MPHGGLHWAKGGPIIRRRPGNLSPLKGLISRRIAGPRPAAVATFFRRCAADLDASSMLTPLRVRARLDYVHKFQLASPHLAFS